VAEEDGQGGSSENEGEEDDEEGSGGAARARAVLGGHAGSYTPEMWLLKLFDWSGTPSPLCRCDFLFESIAYMVLLAAKML
jgi:hypothetical protein